MKKLMYLLFIFVAVSLVVAAPFAGASKEAGQSGTVPTQAQDPLPADWPDGPGEMPRLIGGKKADRPLIATYPDGHTEGMESVTASTIDLWYGANQNFGQRGNPQQWINIVGNASADAGIQSLTYSVNGGADQPLTVGTNNARLIRTGDFNIELDYALLNSGLNTIGIKGFDKNSQPIPQKDITVNYTKGQTWPQSYDAKWNTTVQDDAQVVDGKWGINGDGNLFIKEVGYDRLVAIGDVGDAVSIWTDYEVTVPITVNSLNIPGGYDPPSNGPGIGLLMRWQGQTSKNGEQPRLEWRERTGALGWYRWDKSGEEGLELRGNNWHTGASTAKVWELGTTYIVKMSVQSTPDSADTRAYYRLKFWKKGTTEPGAWDIEGFSKSNNQPSGSVVLVAHEVDAEFGDVQIRPLSDLTFTLTTGVTGAGTLNVNGEPPVPGKIYSYGQKVTLRALPGPDNYLESWSGDFSLPGSINPLNINMTKNMDVTANFKEGSPGKLTVKVVPAGAGTVTADPTGPDYPGGQLVKLTAVPNSGYLFKAWSGAASGTLNPTSVRIDGNKTVTATFIDAGEASPISDDFNRCELNTKLWKFVDPSSNGSQKVVSGVLELTVPAGPTMTMYDTDRDAPRIMQATVDQDFDVVIRFNSIPENKNHIQGFLVQQDASNWIRFDVFYKSGLKMFAGVTTKGVTEGKWNESVNSFGATEVYMRVSRVGDKWSQSFSIDGINWQNPQNPTTFEKALEVKSTGIFAGNQNAAGGPQFVAQADYFKNLAFPAGASGYLLDVSVNGDGAVQLSPEPDENGRYGCDQTVTLTAEPKNTFTGWSGALSGIQNPAVLKMNGDKAVTAHFGSDPGGAFKSYMPSVVRP